MKKFLSTIVMISSIAIIVTLSVQAPNITSDSTQPFVQFVTGVNNYVNERPIDPYLYYGVIRKFAHTIEYIFLGLGTTFFFEAWIKKRSTIAAFIICMTCSIRDQLSKIIIPGREFDITDIPFDFMGYTLAILLFLCQGTRYRPYSEKSRLLVLNIPILTYSYLQCKCLK